MFWRHIGLYWKTIFPAVAAILATALPLVDGHLTTGQWVNVAIMVGGTLVTYTATNMSDGIARWTKEIIGVITAALVVAQSALSDDRITSAEWKQIVLAAAAALLVMVKRNDGYVRPDFNNYGGAPVNAQQLRR